MYAAFNARDIPAVLTVFHPRVRWPRAWEGDYVDGPEAVRHYWQHQWQEINPTVEPVAFAERPDGRIEVSVHQVVRDLQGGLVFDGLIKHVYTLADGLIRQMDIEPGSAPG